MPDTKDKPSRVLLFGFLAFSLVVLGTLVAVEIGLRIAGYSYPPLFMYDPDVGARHRPSASGWQIKEAKQYITINAQGIRVPSNQPEMIFSLKKKPETYRIAVFGDSYTEGLQVTYRERFTHIMERLLNRCPAKPNKIIEVINFGLSGTGQARQMAYYQSIGRQFEPDAVFDMVYPGNDFRNNVRSWRRSPHVPYWDIDQSGELVIDTSFRDDPTFQRKLKWSYLRQEVVKHSRILQLATEAYVGSVLKPRQLAKKDSGVELPPNSVPLEYAAPRDPVRRKAWSIFMAGIKKWAKDVAAENRLFMLSVFPTRTRMVTEEWAELKALHGDRVSEDHLDRVLKAYGDEIGFVYLPIVAAMYEKARLQDLDYWYHAYINQSGGHFNAIGHRVAGEELARQICAYWSTRHRRR